MPGRVLCMAPPSVEEVVREAARTAQLDVRVESTASSLIADIGPDCGQPLVRRCRSRSLTSVLAGSRQM